MVTVTQRAAAPWLKFAPSAGPRSLAVLRIATAIAAIQIGRGWLRADELAMLPRGLWFPPFGTRWLADVVPVSPEIFSAAAVLFLAASILVLVGYRAQLAASIAVFSGLYVGWIPHLAGKVDHYHHIIWFLALLALSPCDDRLSVSGPRPLRRPESYALPALAGVLLLGVIYLSSGLPKLSTGLDWALSDNLRNLMWNHWWEKQHVAPLPIDEWPVVYRAMGFGTIAFELLFLPAALYPPTRKWVRWIGLAFHLAIRVFFAINFWTLAILYVVLFDWDSRSETRATTHRPKELDVSAPNLASLALVLVVAAGALTIPAGWPLSAFPGFAGVAQPHYLEFELVADDETMFVTRSGLADRYGAQKARPMAAIALATGNVPALLAHVADIEGRESSHYRDLRPVLISTHPDSAGDVISRSP